MELKCGVITTEAKERALIINNIRCLKYHWVYFRNTDGQADVRRVGACEQQEAQTVAVVFISNYTSFFLIMTFDEKWRQLYRIQILIYEHYPVRVSKYKILRPIFVIFFKLHTYWECIVCFHKHIMCICPSKLLNNPWKQLLLAPLVSVHGNWDTCFRCKPSEQCGQHQPALLVWVPALAATHHCFSVKEEITHGKEKACVVLQRSATLWYRGNHTPHKSKDWRHNPYTSNMAIIRDRPFRKVDPNPIWQAYQNAQRHHRCVCTEEKPRADTEEGWLSASQRERPLERARQPTLLHTSSYTSKHNRSKFLLLQPKVRAVFCWPATRNWALLVYSHVHLLSSLGLSSCNMHV